MAARAKLYWNPVCPFVHRTWITAVEKGAPLDLEWISLTVDTEWYIKDVNPDNTVPTLRTEDGKLVFESHFIARYIDETYGVKNALQPGGPLENYQANRFIEEAGDFIGNAYGLLMAEPKSKEATEAADALRKSIATLEASLMSQSTGPYFFGNTFSYADIALIPFLDRFRYTLKAYHNFNLFFQAPRLKLLMDTAATRPSVSQTSLSGTTYIKNYGDAGYAKGPSLLAKPKIYVGPSPYSESVLIAAEAKGIDYEKVELGYPSPDWFQKIVPSGNAPAVVLHDDRVLTESLLIAQWLDEEYAFTADMARPKAERPNLLPTDPLALHDTRLFSAYIRSDDVKGPVEAVLYNPDQAAQEAGRKEVPALLEKLEARIAKQSSGPFFLGAEYSFADVVNVPFLERAAAAYEALPDAKPGSEAYPRLFGLLKAAREQEPFSKVLPERSSFNHNGKKE